VSAQVKSIYCEGCGQNRPFERPKGANHVLHLLVVVAGSLLLYGAGLLWIPIWVLCSCRPNSGNCRFCGARAKWETFWPTARTR